MNDELKDEKTLQFIVHRSAYRSSVKLAAALALARIPVARTRRAGVYARAFARDGVAAVNLADARWVLSRGVVAHQLAAGGDRRRPLALLAAGRARAEKIFVFAVALSHRSNPPFEFIPLDGRERAGPIVARAARQDAYELRSPVDLCPLILRAGLTAV
jgi:hypothetical protein